MKILIYAHHFPPIKGGMEYSNFEISRGLYNLGHQVEVVACRNNGIEKFISDLDFRVHLLPKWPHLPTYSLSGMARANWVYLANYRSIILNKINSLKPDIIFVSDETSNCFWGRWAKHVHFPYVSYCSVPFLAVNLKPGRFGILSKIKFRFNKAVSDQFKRYMAESYSNAKRVMVVSRSTKQELLQILPQLSDKMDIIPRSIGDKFFDEPINEDKIISMRKNLGIRPGDIVLLSVSTLIMSKGIDDILKAIKNIDKSILERIRYIAVGQGRDEIYFRDLAKKFHLDENVIFAGEISHEQVVDYYDLCDFFVLPSRKGMQESFGRVFAEAAARSKPSIGVNECGVIDVIDDGVTGFLVSRADIKKLTDRITDLCSDREKREILGKRAREKAENNFRSKTVALKIEKCLSRNAE
jgi:glycosyltransferase involved in cell wall biosynthesis